MNWKQEAINDLTNYGRRKDSLNNIREQLGALKAQYGAIKIMAPDTTPVMGGGSRYEDRLLNNIVKRQRLQLTYQAARRLVELVEKGLAGLDERERKVLSQFYMQRAKGFVEDLMDDLGVEKRQVYNIKEQALYKFTINMYGIEDF